jgi:hypothetical protein
MNVEVVRDGVGERFIVDSLEDVDGIRGIVDFVPELEEREVGGVRVDFDKGEVVADLEIVDVFGFQIQDKVWFS